MERIRSFVGTSSIVVRLVASFGVLALMTGVVGGFGLWAFGRLNDTFQVTVHESLPAVVHLLQADHDMQQVMVAERTLMFMKIDTPAAQEQLKSLEEHLRRLTERWQKYAAIPAREAEGSRRSAFEAARAEWEVASRDVAKVLAQDTPGARRDAIDLSMGEGTGKFDRARGILGELIELRLAHVKAHASTEGAAAERMAWWVLVSVVGAFALAAVLGVALARWVARPLRETVGLLRDIAEGAGDLTRRLSINRQDEVGELARWFNLFMDKLQDIIGRVKATVVHVSGAAQQLSVATERLSTGVQEQASALEETAASLEQITGTIKQNADNARQANQLAVGSRDTAERGGQVVTTAVAAMGEINRASKKIADIITTIDEIAFQTNLLALNAAVEAARAGEQGRGFAVVAAEVRNLAQRSAGAAKEIKALIRDSVGKVEGGSELVNRSGQTLGEIVGSVKRVTEIIAEIAAASQEQAQGIDQVNRAVGQMDQVVQTNAAHSEELSSTAQALAAQAGELQALVGRFKVADVAGGPEPGAVAFRKEARTRPIPARPVLAGAGGGGGWPGVEPDLHAEF